MALSSVAGLMGIVAVIALGMAAMMDASALTSGVVVASMLVMLLVATLGALIRPAPAASWKGFALFGWTYFTITFLRPDLGWDEHTPLPTGALIFQSSDRFHPIPQRPPELDYARSPRLRIDHQGNPIQQVGQIPAADDEIDAAKAYYALKKSFDDSFRDRDRRLERSRRIGHATLAIAFGLLGAIIGRAMAPGRCSASKSRSGEVSSPA